MSAKNNNNNKQQQQVHSKRCEPSIFGMDLDIKDDFIDPFTDVEQKMCKDFKKSLNDFAILSEENQHPRNEPKEQPERQQPKQDGTYISRVYCSSYSNVDGQPHQECYQSQSIKQMNEGHNISEAREAYKNSDGVMKSAYQRGLDEKGARFIKEKNTKTGKHAQHKVLKGIKENEIDGFNKEYDAYSKKCGFKKNYKALNGFGPSMKREMKQIAN
jgi:hypothetical protein